MALALGLAAAALGATEVRFFAQRTREAFLEGSLEGVSIDERGGLRLAASVTSLGAVAEPFVFALARHPGGWVLGTGNSGRVLLLAADGSARTLLEAAEPAIFALRVEEDGTVFAGSSPRGKVYRIAPDGSSSVFFAPGQDYIWGLDRGAGGDLLVATGTSGILYAVSASGEGRVLFDAEEPHLRSLLALPGGDVLLGTADDGLILRLDPAGRARALHDAVQPEVVALAAAPDGRAWAALVDSEASLTATAAEAQGGSDDEEDEEENEEADEGETVVVSAEPSGGRRGPRSEIVRVSSDGLVESLSRFDQDTVYDLLFAGDRLWVATGLEGKVFSLREGRVFLEQDLEPRQVVAVASGETGPVFATTNATGLYRSLTATVQRGTYTSAPLDAGLVADFGALRWLGEQPAGSEVSFAARSGMSRQPDRTWTTWTLVGGGREVSLAALPPGRYVQWRADLAAADGASAVLSAVELSYRQRNLPPRIAEFSALDPGQVLVPSNFNAGDQVYELAAPGREGIFTSVEPAAEPDGGRLKTLWRYGFRTLRWQVEDPNGDDVVAELAFQPEGGSAWFAMQEELSESHYSFDATVLPDGVYRFRLRVSDEGSNRGGEPQVAERVSEPVIVDHTPPQRRDGRRDGNVIEVGVEDALNPLRRAEVSFDAEQWQAVAPVDGLLDGRRETLRVEVEPQAGIVLLRVVDASFNAATFDLGGAEP